MNDLLYFGYTWDKGSKECENDFLKEINVKFEGIQVSNAYDDIKGYRRSVVIPNELINEYVCWIIANGWSGCSLYWLTSEHINRKAMVKLAKKKYPDAFKKSLFKRTMIKIVDLFRKKAS